MVRRQHRGSRSTEGFLKQRERYFKIFINFKTFHDRQKRELVALTEGSFQVSEVYKEVVQGEILEDSRGGGTIQKIM
jgi:hypothetical protein